MKRWLSIILSLVMVVVLATGCDSGGESEKQAADIELFVATLNEPTTFNKYNANDANTNFYAGLIYSNLYNFDENAKLTPELAESYELLENNSIMRFHLRKDVKWHNGDVFTADDVVFSLQTARNSSFVTTINSVDADNVKAVDETTVDVGLSYYDPSLIYNLANLAILHRASTEGVDAAAYDANPVGTGPFKFVEWEAGDHVTLEVFDDYFLGATKQFKKITFRIIGEQSTRAVELETGGCDAAITLSTNDAERLEADPNVNIYKVELGQHYFISFNCQKEPFNNPKVREAICHAIDAKAIREAVWKDYAKECGSPCMPPSISGYYDCGGDYEVDLEYAKKCLEEAGYPNGFSTTIVANNQAVTCEMVQFELAKIGIDVTINNTDRATWVSALVNGNQDMYVGGWTNGTGDAAYSMQAFHSANFGGGGNRSFYSNPELDALIDQASTEADEATRMELYKQCQIMVYDDFVYAPLWVGIQLHGARTDLDNYVIQPDQEPMYELLTVNR